MQCFSGGLMKKILTAVLLFTTSLYVQAQTATLTFSPTVVQSTSNVRRVGFNIDPCSSYDNGNRLKNIIACGNVGFENLLLGATWTQQTAGTDKVTFTVPYPYAPWVVNRFAGAAYYFTASQVGNTGCTGTIASNTAGGGPDVILTLNAPTNCGGSLPHNIGAGDVLAVELNEFPTAEASWEAGQNIASGGGGCSITGAGKITTDSSTPYDGKQSLVLDTTSGGTAQCTFYFNNGPGNIWVLLNGTYKMGMAAKMISGSTTSLTYAVGAPNLSGCSWNPTLTTSWVNLSNTGCTATQTDTTTPSNQSVTISISTGNKAEIDDVLFQNIADTNPTIYRDAVISTMKTLCGGGISGPLCSTRLNDGAFGQTMNGSGYGGDNWIAQGFTALQSLAGPGQDTTGTGTLSLPDYMAILKEINGTPYFAMPITMSPQEMVNTFEYLYATSGTYASKRPAGHTNPYCGSSGDFPVCYLSIGNEAWNTASAGVNVGYRSGGSSYQVDYDTVVGNDLAAIYADSYYNSSSVQLGFNMQQNVTFDLAIDIGVAGALGGAPTYLEQAPYTNQQISSYQSDAEWVDMLAYAYGVATNSSGEGYLTSVNLIKSLTTCGKNANQACLATFYEQNNSVESDCSTPQTPSCKIASIAITGGNLLTVQNQGTNNLASGDSITLENMTSTPGIALNGRTFTVLSSGLSTSQWEATCTSCTNVASTTDDGTFNKPGNQPLTQNAMDVVNVGCGQALVTVRQAINNIQTLGINYQHLWALSEYENTTLYGTVLARDSKLFGIEVGMGDSTAYLNGTTATFRPQGLGLQLLNLGIIGEIDTATFSGSGLTYNYGGSVVNGPTAAQSGVPYMDALYSRDGTGNYAFVIDNTNSSPFTVTLAGSGLVPTGTITLNTLTCSSLDAMNEAHTGSNTNTTAATVVIANSTTGSNVLTIPAYSIVQGIFNNSSSPSIKGPVLLGKPKLMGHVVVK
jgi:hypothetical protein